jgi:hypothetical protein
MLDIVGKTDLGLAQVVEHLPSVRLWVQKPILPKNQAKLKHKTDWHGLIDYIIFYAKWKLKELDQHNKAFRTVFLSYQNLGFSTVEELFELDKYV